jgi:gamma-glutamyltranspeptidase
MTLEDLASHKTQFDEPISYTYQNSFTLHEPPPNNSGLTVLIALGIVDALQKTGKVDLNKVEHNSAQWMHILMWALRNRSAMLIFTQRVSATGLCRRQSIHLRPGTPSCGD